MSASLLSRFSRNAMEINKMKVFPIRMMTLSVSLILFCSLSVPSTAQKKDKNKGDKNSDEESDMSQSSKYSLDGSRNRDDNTCSCRRMEAQIETLEIRLDRMIDLWNDFVDKNRSPYDQDPYPRPGGNRRPPQGGMGGGRGPYLYPERPGSGRTPPMRRPGSNSGRAYDGRIEDYDQDQGTMNPRRFRF